ncbi:MAG: hypothetical protein JST00_22970 [Deltaproteobacteria bacterium]|nr:hypothetical protein [Deltaproteobacteria bacterium]
MLASRLLATAVVASSSALALASSGCSGAENQDLFQGTSAESDVQGTLPAPSPSSTSPSDSTSPPSSSGATPAPTSTTPPSTPPSTPPAEACVVEKEPNNVAATATAFKTCLKGQLANNADVDFGSFEVPAGTKSTSWSHKESGGNVIYRFQMEGLPVDVGGSDGDLRLQPGQRYVVRVAPKNPGNGGSAKTWELELSFK